MLLALLVPLLLPQRTHTTGAVISASCHNPSINQNQNADKQYLPIMAMHHPVIVVVTLVATTCHASGGLCGPEPVASIPVGSTNQSNVASLADHSRFLSEEAFLFVLAILSLVLMSE